MFCKRQATVFRLKENKKLPSLEGMGVDYFDE
jgi:hypothetical protein